jgi:hypothetical protein
MMRAEKSDRTRKNAANSHTEWDLTKRTDAALETGLFIFAAVPPTGRAFNWFKPHILSRAARPAIDFAPVPQAQRSQIEGADPPAPNQTHGPDPELNSADASIRLDSLRDNQWCAFPT